MIARSKSVNPRTGRPVKFGRLPRRPGLVHLHFSDFVQHAKMPTIPPTFDYWTKANSALRDVYGNDQLGDCAVAMMFHAAGTFTGNATGTPYHAPLSDVTKVYSRISGYVPGDPSTDNGCVLTDVLDDWKNTGLPNGEKILGYISVNASSFSDVLACNFLFENLEFGMGLPDAWVNPFPVDGGTWDVAGVSDPNNGHAVLGCSGASSGPGAGIWVDTWGERVRITPAAIAAYAGSKNGGELWSVITKDILDRATDKAPNGLAWADLVAAFDAKGGNVPLPPPPVPPAPTPQPSTGVTLAAAEAAVDKALASSFFFLPSSIAAKIAKKGLETLTGWAK